MLRQGRRQKEVSEAYENTIPFGVAPAIRGEMKNSKQRNKAMMNKMVVNGRIVRCGVTPWIIRECGFQRREEVCAAAAKYGKRVAGMRMDDVVLWFEDVYGREEA